MGENANKKKTNLKLFGVLGRDPELYTTKAGKLQAEFSLAYQPNKKYPACWVEFIVYDAQIAEYIVENFHKGDRVWVLEATPAPRLNPSPGQVPYKFVCWNVAAKQEKREDT